MKFSTILCLALLILSTSNAQLSAKLDSTVFFKSVQFGQIISKDFFRDCPNVENFLNNYRLVYDSLSNTCKKKYADLFNFYGTAFSGAEIQVNDKSEAYLIRLWRSLNPTDSIDAANIKYPEPIAVLYDSLVLSLGKPGQVINETPPEDANYIGLRQVIIWEGYHTSAWLYVQFGPHTGWHEMRIDIKSGKFEDIPEEESEQ